MREIRTTPEQMDQVIKNAQSVVSSTPAWVDPRPKPLKDQIAALEAERDEWKRRCEAMSTLAAEWHESNGCVDHWERSKGYLARALAIAEGRDNG